MNRKDTGTFTSLNPEAELFQNLETQNKPWWQLVKDDDDLYIDIRKNNYINVYFNGGSVFKLEYLNGFKASTHQKYLGDTKSRRKDNKNRDIFEYNPINLDQFDKYELKRIKENIKAHYSDFGKKENIAEKYIQAELVKNKQYIDTEFQYNQDSKIGKLRIDLIKLDNNTLTFVELKGIMDSRLLNKIEQPEVIDQMNKYALFIGKYENELLNYYKEYISLKDKLGIIDYKYDDLKISLVPELLIVNTYQKETDKRTKRISNIEEVLQSNSIKYNIEYFGNIKT